MSNFTTSQFLILNLIEILELDWVDLILYLIQIMSDVLFALIVCIVFYRLLFVNKKKDDNFDIKEQVQNYLFISRQDLDKFYKQNEDLLSLKEELSNKNKLDEDYQTSILELIRKNEKLQEIIKDMKFNETELSNVYDGRCRFLSDLVEEKETIIKNKQNHIEQLNFNNEYKEELYNLELKNKELLSIIDVKKSLLDQTIESLKDFDNKLYQIKDILDATHYKHATEGWYDVNEIEKIYDIIGLPMKTMDEYEENKIM